VLTAIIEVHAEREMMMRVFL